MFIQPRGINLTTVPDCGIACLIDGLAHASCAATNETCLETDQIYNDWVTGCVESNCTIRDQLLTQRAVMLGAGVEPQNHYTDGPLQAQIIITVLGAVFFSLRLANKIRRISSWEWDDTTCAVAWAVCLLFIGIIVAEVKLHAGRSLWAQEFSQIDTAIMLLWASQILYGIALGMGKSSILFLYTRIFSHRETFQRIVWATQLFNLLVMVVFTISDCLECRPISFFWQNWDGAHTGTCVDIKAYAYTHSEINILLDIWMIILPAAQIWKLNMAVRKKLETIAMFAFGVFLTLTTCIRLKSIKDYYDAPTSQDGWFPIAVWSVVEVNVGVIAACVPSARMFVVKSLADIAQSTGWSRLSETRRSMNESLRNRASFVSRRSVIPARNKASLSSTLAETKSKNAGEASGKSADGNGNWQYEKQSPHEISHVTWSKSNYAV